MTDYKPLQTHGLCKTKRVWNPPKLGRFMAADKSDEHWMRPLMMAGDGGRWGTISVVPDERYPVDLYDVRDERNELIGYSSLNPCDQWNSRWPELVLNVIAPEDRYIRGAITPEESCGYKQITIRVTRWRASDEDYVAWQARFSDAFALIRGGWLKVLGTDNIREWEYIMRQKQYDREFRHIYPLT